jgi:hypothetical protein
MKSPPPVHLLIRFSAFLRGDPLARRMYVRPAGPGISVQINIERPAPVFVVAIGGHQSIPDFAEMGMLPCGIDDRTTRLRQIPVLWESLVLATGTTWISWSKTLAAG